MRYIDTRVLMAFLLVAPALVRLAIDDNDHRMAAHMLDGWLLHEQAMSPHLN